MLTKTTLRALSPGQWARVRVPDYECWQKTEKLSPSHARRRGRHLRHAVGTAPRYDDPTHFHWIYQRRLPQPRLIVAQLRVARGCWLSPWDFGLIDASTNSPNWDKEHVRRAPPGQGQVAVRARSATIPSSVPAATGRATSARLCGKFVKPFSNDEGDLICPTCEATGLVILDDEQLDRLEQVREFARLMGLDRQLETPALLPGPRVVRREDRSVRARLRLRTALVQLRRYILPAYARSGERTFSYNGGMIYQGPSCPADGSFPSLTVSLASGTGWFCHT